jgi:site-specific recombinase XerD
MDIFSSDEVLRVLALAMEESADDWLLMAVTFIYALRRAEAVSLKADNLDADYLVLKRGKGSKMVKRKLLVHENPLLNIREALLEKARTTRWNQRLFPISPRTFQRRVHYYGEKVGLPKFLCHPHTFRHSIIQFLRDSGMELEEIQGISGHVSLDSLRVYLHPQPAVIESKFNHALQGV